jgi:hypothetical protein
MEWKGRGIIWGTIPSLDGLKKPLNMSEDSNLAPPEQSQKRYRLIQLSWSPSFILVLCV